MGIKMEQESQDVKPYCFTCTECHSDQRINPFTNVWVQDGKTPPCKACGGIVLYVEADSWEELAYLRQVMIANSNTKRGLPN